MDSTYSPAFLDVGSRQVWLTTVRQVGRIRWTGPKTLFDGLNVYTGDTPERTTLLYATSPGARMALAEHGPDGWECVPTGQPLAYLPKIEWTGSDAPPSLMMFVGAMAAPPPEPTPRPRGKRGPKPGSGGAPKRSTKVLIGWRIEPETRDAILDLGTPAEALAMLVAQNSALKEQILLASDKYTA